MQKEIEEIEPGVVSVKLNGRQLYLVGTAHVSRRSVELVERVITTYRPASVAVELCDSRFQSLRDPQRWRNMDIYEIIKSGKAYVLMAQLVLASFQKRLGEQLDIKPGEEMRRAMDLTDAHGASLVLADRDVRISLKRAWARASLWSLTKIVCSLIASLFKSEKLDEAEIERLKQVDALEGMMAEFSQYLPQVKEVLIDERDAYLAAKIQESHGDPLVAVVGAGHLPGIQVRLGTPIDIAALEELPPPRRSTAIIGWGFPLLICSLLAYAFISAGAEFGTEMLKAWVLPHSILSALGAAIALGHPLTILTAFVVAPYTALNPLVAAGWFAGLVEALVHKPRVADLEKVAEDITTIRGIWSNRVTRVLLIMALSNVGSSLGTVIGVGWIASLFGGAG